jgi:hypothetical protein
MADSIVVLTDTTSTVTSTVVTSLDVASSTIITSGFQGPAGVSGNEIVLTFSSNTTISEQVLDSFSYTTYGGAKYVIYATVGSSRQICEILLLHDSVNVTIVEYANIVTSNILCAFNGSISGANVQLLITPSNISTNFKIIRTLLPA